jgi:hypothetical protein
MAAQRIHIVPHDQGWALKREGQNSVESVHQTQKDAIDAGRDIAREDEVDIVVHRSDGTFRNVLTYTNDPMSDNNGNKKVEAHDLISVGTRVSWGAVLIGACVALAISAVLWMGGVALGLTVHERMDGRALSMAGGIWILVSTLFALFAGGFVVSRLTAGENKTEAVMYGVALWGVLFALAMVMGSSGATTATQIATLRPTADRALLTDESIRELGLNETQREKLATLDRQARDAASSVNPTEAAWWSFASMVLSMGAAVLGSVLGSGPEFYLRRFTTARQPSAQIQPS